MLKEIPNPTLIEPICEEIERPERANNDWIYYCPHCGQKYTSFNDALECCQDVNNWYECRECGSQYDDLEQAKYCCQD